MQVVSLISDPGEIYDERYVTALKNQVPDLVVIGHDRPLLCDYHGWLAKIELFAPHNRDLRPFLYLDLDTYVTGSLDINVDTEKLWLIDDFNRPEWGETGIMVVPENTDEIWWRRAEMWRSDGEYIRQFPHERLNSVVSGIYSYKLHCQDEMPDDARIICFHGRPKPHQTDGWAGKFWNEHIETLV